MGAEDLDPPGEGAEAPAGAGSRERAAVIQARVADRRATLSAEARARLAERLRRRPQTETRTTQIPRRAAEGPAPLSFAQERLWFLQQMDLQGSVFNMPVPLRCRGPLLPVVLRESLAELLRRHDILRAVFLAGDGAAQVIRPASEVPAELPCIDLGSLPDRRREIELDRLVAAEVRRPFDLERGPMLRTSLLRLGATDHVMLAVMHHIVSDAWSLDLLTREIMALYGAFAGRRPSPLPPLPVQYTDFAAWQREWLAEDGEALRGLVEHWRRRLAGIEPLELPTDRPRPAVRRFLPGHLFRPLEAPLLEAARHFARQADTTLVVTLLTVWKALLRRYTRQSDVTVGSFTAGRTRPEVEGLIGFFVNNLVLRTDLAGARGLREALRRVQATVADAYAHQDLPFEKLLQELAPERLLSSTPLFQVTFLLEERAGVEDLRLHGLEMSLLPLSESYNYGGFDLTLVVKEKDLRFGFEYNREIFDTPTAARMAGHFRTLLGAALEQTDADLAGLPLLAAHERQQLVREWNDTGWRALHPPLVHTWFELQAERTPEAVAAVFGEERLSYGELNRAANRLAHRLLRMGVGPDVSVGIYVERSLDVAVGVLGILKAGGPYVPLDPAYPRDRLAYMLQDAGARVLVTHEGLSATLPVGDLPLVLLDRDRDGLAAENAGNPDAGAAPESLAYAIYTSGSTGRPKGIGLSHRALTNLLEWHLATLRTGVRTLQFAALSFDASFHEMFAAWYSGGTLVLVPEVLRRDIGGMVDLIVRERVEKAIFPVVVLHQLAEEVLARGILLPLEEITTTGEQLQVNQAVIDLFERLPGVPLHNHYGPSESHVVTAYTLSGEPAAWPGVPPVGRPIYNSWLHLLDPLGQPVPTGVAGELFLGGVCLARGYLGRPDLTAARFVPDPFSAEPGERLYRTGDLARCRPDGVVEFLGRMDDQVKIRGFRVEPGEIETVLGRHPAVREVAVVARELRPGDRQLVAYVVAEPGTRTGELRSWLAELLPDYMVPAAVVSLSALPLTPSGKIDRRNLPAPVLDVERGSWTAPRTLVEEILAGIWSELLGIPRVGAHDDFFALGGHSLLATRLVSRVRRAFRVEIPLRALFEARTLAEFAARIERARGGREGDAPEPPIEPVPRQGPLPLSYAQQRLWFLDRLETGSAAYNIPLVLQVSGDLDPRLLERSLGEVARRHEALRTVFADADADGDAVQRVLPPAPWALPLVDLSALAAPRADAVARRLAVEDAGRPFDLVLGPLLRTALLRLPGSGREHVLLVNMHHIVSDGWSMGVLVREAVESYRALRSGEAPDLPELPVQYADYAVWQRGWLRGETLARQVEHWRRHLAGAPAVLELPYDRPRPAVQSYRGAVEPFALPRDLAQGLEALGRRHGATFFMTLLAAFASLLGRHSGQDDVVVGSPIANRTRQEVEELIGFFVNTLALRVGLAGGPTLAEVLERVRQTSLDAYAHQDLPFEKLVEELQPERNLSHQPIFQAMLVLQNAPVSALEVPGLSLRPIELDAGIAKFDWTLLLYESEGGWSGHLEYSTDLFDRPTVVRFLGQLRRLLSGMAEDAGRRLADVDLLGEVERHQLLAEWSGNGSAPPLRAECAHHLFEAQAARTPEEIAVVDGEESLTYGELDRRANRLARRLRRLGVGPDVPVALCLESSLDMVLALLATLKAGGPYLPLDPAYPAERLAYMLEDAGPAVVLTWRRLGDRLPERGAPRVFLEEIRPLLDQESDAAVDSGASADNLGYVIYTSGSTGRPKGIGLSHRALVNLIEWHQESPSLLQAARTLQFASLSFDASFHEMFAAWASGGTVLLLPEGLRRDVRALIGFLDRHRVEKAVLPVVILHQMAEELLHDGGAALPLKEVTTTGEQLRITGPVVELFLRNPAVPLHNHYGPSESHVVTATTLGPDPAEWPATPSIGRPIQSSQVYVLDRDMRPVPPGVLGELYLGGVCLARGYHGRPGLTAEKFVPDPFAPSGGRLYRTGDLARFRQDGSLDFFGRIDHQVKIRGFRIEPGEIEAALHRHPAVQEAVVLLREDRAGERRLTAYVVAGAEPPSAAELRSWLAQSLPDYMIPSAFVPLESLPLTPNRKVDRRALPAPETVCSGSGPAEPPRTPTEELVAGIWAGVLGLDRVGIHDSFFDLGGHSLLAIRVVSRVCRAFGVDLPLKRLFQSPTVEALARVLDQERAAGPGRELPPLFPRPDCGPAPLSFAQERLWFLDCLSPGTAVYNLPAPVRLRGELDAAVLERCLAEIVRRHEAVRTTFAAVDGRPMQRIEPFRGWTLPRVDLAALPSDRRETEARRLADQDFALPFDLAAGPLLRTTLLRLEPGEHRLLLNMHHIVSDGWSMEVLVREAAALYRAFSQGQDSPLPELPVQYADFAVWQREWLAGEVLDAQLAYWTRQLAGAPVLELPLDRPRPALRTYRGGRRDLHLAAPRIEALGALGRGESATLFMTFLAVFLELLRRYTSEEGPTVGTPIANRRLPEVEGLIGFFVNTLVLRGDLSGDPSFREVLGRVRQTTLDAWSHQDLPFERLVEELQPRRDRSQNPLFQAALALQRGAGTEAVDLPGAALEPWDFDSDVAKFDWTLWLVEEEDGIAAGLEYAADLFEPATIERVLRHFDQLLAAVVEDPARRLSELPALAAAERHQLRVEWSDTRPAAAPFQPLHEIVAGWAARTPDAPAASSGGEELAYAELDRRANQLARHLRGLGVGPETLVGLCLDRSLDIPIAVLGIWKAGGAYVPLDPSYPPERLAWLLADSGVPVLVTREEFAASLPLADGVRRVLLDADAGDIVRQSAEPLGGAADPDDPAYVIYTSGSTGRPKGVVIPHRGLSNLVRASEVLAIHPGCRVLQFGSQSFDAAVWDLAMALGPGATLCLESEESMLPGPDLARLLAGRGITHVLLPPAALAVLPAADLPALGTLISGGEACPPELVERWAPGRRFLNAYGPTEGTVCATLAEVRDATRRPPIGRPLTGARIHLLDAHLREVPLGAPGELFLGGPGLARGYLRRPDLTAERFVPDPFGDGGGRLYRTGDLARHRADGQLEYLGRTDHQVKLRGFRIELGEIEAALARLPGVRQAAALARQDEPGETRLVAYVVPDDGEVLPASGLRDRLRETLPHYMVPSAFVLLDALPLTPNGKLDRRALPAPERGRDGRRELVAPRTPAEETIVAIWAELLGVEEVGVEDDFFDLGGHSLLATRIVSRVREAFALDLPVRMLFEVPTVAGLARVVEAMPWVIRSAAAGPEPDPEREELEI